MGQLRQQRHVGRGQRDGQFMIARRLDPVDRSQLRLAAAFLHRHVPLQHAAGGLRVKRRAVVMRYPLAQRQGQRPAIIGPGPVGGQFGDDLHVGIGVQQPVAQRFIDQRGHEGPRLCGIQRIRVLVQADAQVGCGGHAADGGSCQGRCQKRGQLHRCLPIGSGAWRRPVRPARNGTGSLVYTKVHDPRLATVMRLRLEIAHPANFFQLGH